MKGYINNIIIPKFEEKLDRERYFSPRFIKIVKGDTIEWTNFDIRSHKLVFFYQIGNDLIKLGTLGPIPSRGVANMLFNIPNVIRIDYYCEDHPNEIGNVMILPKAEEQMSNTELLRYITKAFDIKLPDFLKHLRQD